ncbi:MAG: hypothetical protein ACF8AM_02555 [Rhodopirellula sp. JB055]|uniref:hypothetical protein n=1 Tax=Rhodopirellula sp. JB055 TaxID=3342846 RepID=UPI003709E298
MQLTLWASPVFAQTTRTNQFVSGTPAFSSESIAAAPEVATARLMLPQSDSRMVKQPVSETPLDSWTPPQKSAPSEVAGFSANAPVGPDQNNFEPFRPNGMNAPQAFSQPQSETSLQPALTQPNLAPSEVRIAMRPGPQSATTDAISSASSTDSSARSPRPQRLPATSATENTAANNSGSTSHAVPPAVAPQHSTDTIDRDVANQRFLKAMAKRRAAERARAPVSPPAATSGMYLATQTAKSKLDEAWTHFQQAELEYSSAAYASAETSAWKTLQLAAEAIDLHDQHTRSRSAIESTQRIATATSCSAVQQLQSGRDALNEAQDFVGPYATSDPDSIARLARSHRTPVVREGLPLRGRTTAPQAKLPTTPKDDLGWYTEMLVESSDGAAATIPTATEAIDRYLDLARMELSEVAGKSLLAAQAMDLLAAIRLGRGEASQLPGPSAICLRRAAVQGQSNNPDLVAKLGFHLAEVGLVEEASWALQHSLTLRYDPQVLNKLNELQAMTPSASTVLKGAPIRSQAQTKRTPDVVTMTPEQFASVSRSVIPAQGTQMHAAANSVPARSVSTRNISTNSSPDAQPASYRHSSTPPATASLGQTHSSARPNSNESTKSQETATRNSSRFLPQLKKWW